VNTGVIQDGGIQRGGEESAGDAENKPAWSLSSAVISAAIEVHEVLGPGLLESIYEAALCHELSLRAISVKRQLEVPVFYKGVSLSQAMRLDLLIDDRIVIELKSVDAILPIHKAQLLSYMRLSNRQAGLLINFNTHQLKQGIHRVVNSHNKNSASPARSSSPR
jgi:GxxExxY protein